MAYNLESTSMQKNYQKALNRKLFAAFGSATSDDVSTAFGSHSD